MLLTIDIGNTNLTLGLFEGDQLGAHWRLATDPNRMPDEYGLQFLGLLQNAGKTLEEIGTIDYNDLMDALGKEIVEQRTRCATLSLDTLRAAIRKRERDLVTTQARRH